ncbi:hypothetical protein P8452_76215 [Trifolium repens]|nr:hypothetical protein P8452_76215 [Trifolium repens]
MAERELQAYRRINFSLLKAIVRPILIDDDDDDVLIAPIWSKNEIQKSHKLTTTKSKKEINNNPEIATRFHTQKSDKNNHRNKLLDLQKRSESFLTANERSESTAAEVEVECSSRLEQEQQELPCCSTP